MGYSLWGCKESDRIERLTLSLSFAFFQGMCVCEEEEERPQTQHHWTLRRRLGWRQLFFLYFILVSQNAFKNFIFAF